MTDGSAFARAEDYVALLTRLIVLNLAAIGVLAVLIVLLSLLVRQLLPRPLFVTFAYSHYCENGRWALDMMPDGRRYYYEWKVPVGPHCLLVPILRLLFSQHATSSQHETRTSFPGSNQSHPWYSPAAWRNLRRLTGVPLLIDEDGKCFTSSWALLEHAKLAVEGATQAMLDHELGPAVRTFAYHHIFEHDPRLYRELQSAGRVEMRLFDAWEALFQPSAYIREWLGCSPQGAAAAEATISRVFESISDVLVESPWLGSGTGAEDMGGADVAFAALAGPLLFPPRYSNGAVARVPTPSELGPAFEAFSTKMTASRAGRHVLKCYEKHRGREKAE